MKLLLPLALSYSWMLCGAVTSAKCKSEKSSPLKTLHNSLMCGYDKSERPVKNLSNNVTVGIDLAIQFFKYHMWDAWSKLYIHTWMHVSWNDEYLQWDPSQNSNINNISIDSEEIWFPDLMVYSAVDMRDAKPLPSDAHCQVNSNGRVTCRPPTVLNAQCSSDGHMWPFDTINCTMRVGSASYSGKEMDINFRGSGVILEQYKPHHDWKLLNVTHEKYFNRFENETYVWLTYHFILKREAKANVVGIVTPALVFSILTLASFWMEPNGMERTCLCCTNIVCHFLYLQYIFYIIPYTGNQSPLIVLFLRDSMILTALSLVIAITTQGLTLSVFSPPVTIILYCRRLLNSFFGKCILPTEFSAIQDTQNINEISEGFEMRPLPEELSPQEWRLLAVILDRVFFFLLLFIFCILLFRFIF